MVLAAAPEEFGKLALEFPRQAQLMQDLRLTRRAAMAGSLSLAAVGAGASSAAAGQPYSCYQVGAQEGLASLRRTECSTLVPGPGEVLVAVRAAALNHRDLQILAGRYGARQPEARVPVGDGAGEVVALGEGVQGVSIGQRVTAAHFVHWLDGAFDPAIFAADLGVSRDGWLAQLICLPAAALVALPDGMDYADAAALGAAGITAWAVLVELGGIRPGDTVLTLGTGGVSMLALQIAKMSGARVAVTSSSNAKLELARKLGADITVNYREQPDWEQAIRSATGGRGVDIVVETVGPGTLSKSLACCAPNARIGLLGSLDLRTDQLPDLGPLYFGNLVLKGITSGSRRMLAELLAASAANGLQPRIDRRFAFAEAPAALAYLAAADHVGKVVITDF